MELHSDIKNMKSWKEAALWLARHGWGTALIEQQKEIWDWNESQKPKPYKPPPAKKVTPKPVSPIATEISELSGASSCPEEKV